MSLKSQTALFERIALESEIREHPGDTTAAAALTDWLIEHGYKPLGARREVIGIVREATEELQRVRVERIVNGDGVAAMTMRHAIRREIRVRILTETRIEIVRGGQSPAIVGDVAYWRGINGERYNAAEHALLTEVQMYYQPGRERIVVGAAWVLNLARFCDIAIPT